MQVVVFDMKPDIERDGLSWEQIQTDVELRLRKAGIRVLTEQERLDAPGSPWLAVQVATFQHPKIPVYAFMIGVELMQRTYLERNLDLGVSAATWSTSSRPSWSNGEILGGKALRTSWPDKVLLSRIGRNGLMKLCFLKWQDGRHVPMVRRC